MSEEMKYKQMFGRGVRNKSDIALLVRGGDYKSGAGFYGAGAFGERRNLDDDKRAYQVIASGKSNNDTKHFWYSPTQEENIKNSGLFGLTINLSGNVVDKIKIDRANTCIIDGSEYKYTKMTSSEAHMSKYKDMIYLGEGVEFSLNGALQSHLVSVGKTRA